MRRLPLLLATLALALATTPALAYIGPGAGVTMLGALWGVVVAIALAIGAVVFWPIRALMRRGRKATAPVVTQDGVAAPQDVRH